MDLLNASFKVGRLSGITVRVHILFLIFIGWQLLRAESAWVGALVFLAVLFAIVLVHEFGHCFGARAVGGDAEDILMWPLGGLAYAHAPMTPWAQFVTVACGPLVNLVFAAISGVIVYVQTRAHELVLLNPFAGIMLPPEMTWLACVWVFYQVNLMLLAFNLLPIYPLDGGQLFQCALWPALGLQRAMTLACQVGLLGCIGLGVWGLAGERGSLLVFIAVFGGFTCWQRLRMLKYGMVADERIKYAGYREHRPRRGGLFRRLFKWRPKPRVSRPETKGARESRGAESDESTRREAELDRILKKVREQGLHSLSYVERQALERATRERQQRDREFNRETRV